MAVLKGDRIVILEKVHFYVNDAKIRPESFPVLDAVAATLVAHPEVERIRVEGHTDSDGSESHNLDLSNRRAASVRLYLVERGIDPFRLESVGYGELYPVATNRTPEGREMNRRVEFMVVPPAEAQP
jgi:outer membrane protein OmpA-like peptidoglycan-associated protein